MRHHVEQFAEPHVLMPPLIESPHEGILDNCANEVRKYMTSLPTLEKSGLALTLRTFLI
jgi:hypothetical protein